MARAVGDLLKQHQLGEASVRTDATPRRLVVRAEGVIARQADSEERVWGPAKARPAPAWRALRRSRASTVDKLEILSDGKGGKIQLRPQDSRAAPPSRFWPRRCRSSFSRLRFPKTMYWTGKGGVRFIRPIRWIVALLDDQVIPFEIAGVASGNESSGHRILGAARFPVTYENYEQQASRELRHAVGGRTAGSGFERVADEV